MFLKNYTSDVPVHETIHRIEKTLIKCGVNAISKEYGPQGEIVALTFTVILQDKPVLIRLPVNRDGAQQALWLDYANGDKLSADGTKIGWGSRKSKTKADFAVQADRTAWKIMQDWVEVQMSMIQTKQADFIQVFLPYVWDEQRKQTFYQALKSSGFKALLPEKT
jgi:hypothetical protein